MTSRATSNSLRVRRNGRVFYGDGWSATFFRYGVHVRRRREQGEARWRQYRIAFFAVKAEHPGVVKLIDWSVRDTKNGTSKPVAPCWRFWVGFRAGRTHSDRWYGAKP